jgi:nucleoporin NUP2
LEEDGLARTQSQSPGIQGGEGEGEEDEETTYTIKAKVFKFTTDREGAPTWSDMGIGWYPFSLLPFLASLFLSRLTISFFFLFRLCIGMLRLKKHKETDARRVILRSSTTGKIIIVRWHSLTCPHLDLILMRFSLSPCVGI